MYKPITHPPAAGCPPAAAGRPAVPADAHEAANSYVSALTRLFANLVWLR